MESELIFRGVLIFCWIEYLWETYLQYRQRKLYLKSVEVPAEIASIMPSDKFSKARLYGLDKNAFGIVSGLFNQIVMTLLLCLNGLPALWRYAASLRGQCNFDESYQILQSCIFIVVISLMQTVLNLPWDLYHTFVIEERHGFNKQTIGFYMKDLVKKLFVSVAIIIPIIAGLLYIIKIGGDYFFIYAWIFSCIITLLIVTVYADYIAPLFDTFTPLEEGSLRTAIEKLAASIDFPLTKLYVVDGSKRSSHSNAYFYGFFKNKRIVLFDTLIQAPAEVKHSESGDGNGEKMPEENLPAVKEVKEGLGCNEPEILAILSHELGHWSMNHVLKNIVISQINTFFSFMVFGLLMHREEIYEAFGFDSKPTLIGLVIIFQFIFSPYNEILSFLITMLSRKFEFEADKFAADMGKAVQLASGLIKLSKDNLSFPLTDKWYSTWHYSHPPLLERLDALNLKKAE